jgi:hypothetical protein
MRGLDEQMVVCGTKHRRKCVRVGEFPIAPRRSATRRYGARAFSGVNPSKAIGMIAIERRDHGYRRQSLHPLRLNERDHVARGRFMGRARRTGAMARRGWRDVVPEARQSIIGIIFRSTLPMGGWLAQQAG